MDTPCHVEIASAQAQGAAFLTRYQQMFPWFTDTVPRQARYTVRIRDVADLPRTVAADDPVFGRMRRALNDGYDALDAELVGQICSPAFVPDEAARAAVTRALDGDDSGLSVQQHFLVCTDHAAGRCEILADVAASLREAWAFHVLNFFKIFFFRQGAVRLHGSSATHGERALVLLANTGGGKSTMKNLFMQGNSDIEPFTDDSIIVVSDNDEFRLYQDPVEFMRWCYLPEAQLAEHVIPRPRAPITIAPTIYYMEKADATTWHDCAVTEMFERINNEAFFQKGFLTQRFIPQPDSERHLARYMDTTRHFLGTCERRLAGIRHHDDYADLFAQWRADLGLPATSA